jgi:hypothetical protein
MAERELAGWFPPSVPEEAKPELMRIAIVEHPGQEPLRTLWSIHPEFVYLTNPDLWMLVSWINGDERSRGSLRGVPLLLVQLAALRDHHVALIGQLNELTSNQEANTMTEPIAVDPSGVQHQGTFTVQVDFRATLPPTEFLEGDSVEEALSKFADLDSIRAAIKAAPRVDGISIESIEFGIQVASFLTS